MSSLRPYVPDEELESPATLLSSLPPPSRRHQQQPQSSQISPSTSTSTSTSTAATTTSATAVPATSFPRDQYQHNFALSSDADASSDFSELEVHRQDVPSSSGGEGGGPGDFSDHETALPARWDLTAHWHMGEYYSEGVEGDADDDDDEERDLDTDLSEGPGPGPGLRATRWANTGTRGMHLDMGRVRDILSSPISTPVALETDRS
ncbi:hypothetical protein BGZ95_008080 [Linnemannia exigua]|uniref:Uncharacterized protein n=1 Tax=Linnemannia exigua TaxID=604196 RepID=A0AAD4HAQ6_9FUNG|nr:hypothetical protein BGZ95_008080 [Linnemannia exigua]